MKKELSFYKDFIKKDVLYSQMLPYFNDLKDFENAGFIDEKRNSLDEKAIKNTEIKTLNLNPIKTNKPLAIIVSSGSFSPLHIGHVEIIKQAEKILEHQGYEVLQGVLYYAHDNYVSYKKNGEARKIVSSRIQEGYEFLSSLDLEDKIKIDHFSGQFVSNDLNFSTLLNRLDEYLKRYYKKEVKIFYTFGSDYLDFFNAFKYQSKFGAFCFEREGSEIKENMPFIDNKNLFLIKKEMNPFSNMSSTKVRKKISIPNEKTKELESKNLVYMIREDGVSHEFSSDLQKIIRRYVEENIEVRSFSTGKECFCFENVISLDKFVSGGFNIDMSRLFNLSSMQKFSKKMISLSDPNFLNFQKIKKGDYVLVDDDIVSGETIRKVSNILKENGINIKKSIALIKNYLRRDETLFDIIDARDFYINGEHSGLVTQFMNESPVRTPYLYPLVNLTTRAKIKSADQIFFTIEVLELNDKYNNLNEEMKDLLCFLNNYKKTLNILKEERNE